MDTKALYKISYGMYIVSSIDNNKLNGQIANTVFQITAEPPTIAVSINKGNLTHEFIKNSKLFTVSVLSKLTPMRLIGQFGFKSGRKINKFQDINYKLGVTGVPVVLEHSIAYLETKVVDKIDCRTHTLFIGKVVSAQVISNTEPMSYAYYHEVKNGKSPKTAPTYIEEKNKKEVNYMKKYRCVVCGYIYDPEKGDTDSGISPGTPFEEIPDDWVCSVCGVGKDNFEEV